MERIIRRLREASIGSIKTKGREERVEGIAEFIEESDPQKSIKVVCGSEEVPEVLEGIGKGFQRLEAKKTGGKQDS